MRGHPAFSFISGGAESPDTHISLVLTEFSNYKTHFSEISIQVSVLAIHTPDTRNL
jgi:hypothetical protein